MDRPYLAKVVGVAVLLVAVVWTVVAPRLHPGESTTVNESVDQTDTVLKSGIFGGETGHTVTGRVELVRDEEGYLLRFVNYSQTRGPDVFIYLTTAPDPTTRAAVGTGFKVRIDGGADGGESTKEGTFTQRLSRDIDPAAYEGVAVWCEDFRTPFGAATLDPVEG